MTPRTMHDSPWGRSTPRVTVRRLEIGGRDTWVASDTSGLIAMAGDEETLRGALRHMARAEQVSDRWLSGRWLTPYP